MTKIEAVLWDFGGVITSSPFDAFNRFEAERNIPQNFIRGLNAIDSDTNAWARLERGDIALDEFDHAFERESALLGHAIRGADVIALLGGEIRPEMVAALKLCAEHLKVACITNNVASPDRGPGLAQTPEQHRAIADVLALFDVVIESSRIGKRKPDPQIYQLTCRRLDVVPAQCVYLDDLGINLKPARAMGMTTIKVTDPATALADLGAATGLTLT